MEAVTIIALGFVCMACFLLGAKVGQAVSRGEKIEARNPIKAVKARSADRKAQEEQDIADIIMQNIERYDGTSAGQQNVPRR